MLVDRCPRRLSVRPRPARLLRRVPHPRAAGSGFRRELIEKSLAQANGNQNRAAALLKISRQALAYQIRELGILVTASKRPQV